MSPPLPWPGFPRYGVELEYMVVDAATLDVRPWAERVLVDEAGQIRSDVADGPITWSNELVAHVVELKTTDPAPSLAGLARQFAASIGQVNARLAASGARLLPSAMHPWMDPTREMRLWPHDSGEFYAAFDRVFDCRGHGWANLQSVHLNLPFAGDAEFARWHAAIRLVLPILPALAASSPVCEGRLTAELDHRLEVYRHNCQRIPAITARVVPEPVFSQADYQREILEPMYRQIAPLDPDELLQEQWLNARGAIARWDRGTIEIRVLDVQECPAADLAIVFAAASVVRMLIEETTVPLAEQQAWPVAPLADLFERCLVTAEETPLDDRRYLTTLGYTGPVPCPAGRLWRHLIERIPAGAPGHAEVVPAWQALLDEGPLARRLLVALGNEPDRPRLRQVYGQLADCLAENRMFRP